MAQEDISYLEHLKIYLDELETLILNAEQDLNLSSHLFLEKGK
ncbi:unnamed protein product, partial [Didymodactylos carnosus]